MRECVARSWPQPVLGVVSLAVGALLVGIAYAVDWAGVQADVGLLWLAPCLIAAAVLAYFFPMYVRHRTKICVMTVPYFLMAALLPPPVAATSLGLAACLGMFTVRSRHGSKLSDIASHVGRWTMVAIAASVVAHLPVGQHTAMGQGFVIIVAALVMGTGDVLTMPLEFWPITRENPLRFMRTVAREGSLIEGAQYLVGLLGALIVAQQYLALLLLGLPTALVYLAFRKDVDQDTVELLENMADTVDLRDPYTGGHSRRVQELVRGMLNELGMRGQESKLVLLAARLHDLGKVGLPDRVLIKPHELSPEEMELVRQYPHRGAELLSRYPDFSRGIEMVRHHHERWDGSGYPDGLMRHDIPYGARIIAVADAYDAMTSDRPYRRALSPERAAAVLLDGKGKQWDPELVDVFLKTIEDRLAHPVESLNLRVIAGGELRAVTA